MYTHVLLFGRDQESERIGESFEDLDMVVIREFRDQYSPPTLAVPVVRLSNLLHSPGAAPGTDEGMAAEKNQTIGDARLCRPTKLLHLLVVGHSWYRDNFDPRRQYRHSICIISASEGLVVQQS
jgi:hypothetical protein